MHIYTASEGASPGGVMKADPAVCKAHPAVYEGSIARTAKGFVLCAF